MNENIEKIEIDKKEIIDNNINYIQNDGIINCHHDQIQSKIEEESKKIKENIFNEKKELESSIHKNNLKQSFGNKSRNGENKGSEIHNNSNEMSIFSQTITEEEIRNAPILTISVKLLFIYIKILRNSMAIY